jgi:hypothetical protein
MNGRVFGQCEFGFELEQGAHYTLHIPMLILLFHKFYGENENIIASFFFPCKY